MWTRMQMTNLTANGIVSLAAFAGGVVVGFTIASKRASSKWQKIANEEIADVKRQYALRAKPDLSEMATKYENMIQGEGYISPDPDRAENWPDEDEQPIEEPVVVKAKNIFESDDPDTYWDEDEEMHRRETDPGKPYVLTHDEYMLGERDFNQTTLTWYDGDGVLVDEQDMPVEDIEKTVGNENMYRFGHASRDQNVVYIRNERLSLDIEVLKSDGKYSEEVLGFIEHSDKPKIRKFRDYD